MISSKTLLGLGLASIAFMLVAVLGCTSSPMTLGSDVLNSQVEVRGLDLDIDLEDDEPAWEYPDIENRDGTVTRMLWMPPGEATQFAGDGKKPGLMAGSPLVADELVVLRAIPQFLKQNRRDPERGRVIGDRGDANRPALDALMVTGLIEHVDELTEIIVNIQKSVPQIDVNIRVVEVFEDDGFAFGIDTFFRSVEDDPDAPTRTFFNNAATSLGLPPLAGRGATFSSGNGATPLVIDLGTITDGVQLDFLIRAINIFSRTDLLSAPHVVVKSGFAAEITAGEEIPFFTPNLNASGINTVTTKFKEVGIKLFVTPVAIGRDLVRLTLTTAVEAITGESTFQSEDITISNPITTVRRVLTEMDVPDGHTAIIGGLLTRTRLENENRVPVIGEVPVLNFFFSSRSKNQAQSNLIFFITPKIMDPARERRSVITPVMPVPGDEEAGENEDAPEGS